MFSCLCPVRYFREAEWRIGAGVCFLGLFQGRSKGGQGRRLHCLGASPRHCLLFFPCNSVLGEELEAFVCLERGSAVFVSECQKVDR